MPVASLMCDNHMLLDIDKSLLGTKIVPLCPQLRTTDLYQNSNFYFENCNPEFEKILEISKNKQTNKMNNNKNNHHHGFCRKCNTLRRYFIIRREEKVLVLEPI